MFTLKDFDERKQVICEENGHSVYMFEGHRIAVVECDRSSYYFVVVDGKTIATRTTRSKGVRLALQYINK